MSCTNQETKSTITPLQKQPLPRCGNLHNQKNFTSGSEISEASEGSITTLEEPLVKTKIKKPAKISKWKRVFLFPFRKRKRPKSKDTKTQSLTETPKLSSEQQLKRRRKPSNEYFPTGTEASESSEDDDDDVESERSAMRLDDASRSYHATLSKKSYNSILTDKVRYPEKGDQGTKETRKTESKSSKEHDKQRLNTQSPSSRTISGQSSTELFTAPESFRSTSKNALFLGRDVYQTPKRQHNALDTDILPRTRSKRKVPQQSTSSVSVTDYSSSSVSFPVSRRKIPIFDVTDGSVRYVTPPDSPIHISRGRRKSASLGQVNSISSNSISETHPVTQNVGRHSQKSTPHQRRKRREQSRKSNPSTPPPLLLLPNREETPPSGCRAHYLVVEVVYHGRSLEAHEKGLIQTQVAQLVDGLLKKSDTSHHVQKTKETARLENHRSIASFASTSNGCRSNRVPSLIYQDHHSEHLKKEKHRSHITQDYPEKMYHASPLQSLHRTFSNPHEMQRQHSPRYSHDRHRTLANQIPDKFLTQRNPKLKKYLENNGFEKYNSFPNNHQNERSSLRPYHSANSSPYLDPRITGYYWLMPGYQNVNVPPPADLQPDQHRRLVNSEKKIMNQRMFDDAFSAGSFPPSVNYIPVLSNQPPQMTSSPGHCLRHNVPAPSGKKDGLPSEVRLKGMGEESEQPMLSLKRSVSSARAESPYSIPPFSLQPSPPATNPSSISFYSTSETEAGYENIPAFVTSERSIIPPKDSSSSISNEKDNVVLVRENSRTVISVPASPENRPSTSSTPPPTQCASTSRQWRQTTPETEHDAWWMPREWARERRIGAYSKRWVFENDEELERQKALEVARKANVEQIRTCNFIRF